MKITDARVLRVNLSKGTFIEEAIDEDMYRMYLGGRGMAGKLLADEIDPAIDALSPENKLIFANGLLTGTSAPTGGRYMVITKSPLTGTIASSNSGGSFGADLRRAGYLMIVLEGQSKKPVYLSIKDDAVELKDASHLWGLGTADTTDRVLQEFGDQRGKVACIGPAGEKLSKIACIINDKHRAAGRSGVGAVMGSKNLKAVVVRGTNNVEYKAKDVFTGTVKKKNAMLKENAVTGEGLPALGTKVLDSIINQSGLYPTRNFQFATFADTEEVSGEALVAKGYLKSNKACFGCPIACGRYTVLPNGHEGEGPEYETGWAFGADCGVNDLIAVSEANFICNDLGLDTISTGTTIAAAMEMYEKGYIKKEELGNGPEMKFGSSEAIVYYTRMTGLREGFGDRLAEGSFRLGEHYGHPELSMSVKKQELPAYDPRGVQGHGLSYATSNRGGCHVRGYMISPEILGSPEKLDPQELAGKPQWVKTFQDLTAVIDSAGVCLFSSFALGLQDYTDLINDAAGFNLSPDEVLMIGERVWNMERDFNLKAGITPDQDRLPERFMEPIPDGPQKGAVSHMKELLPEYYSLRGWSKDGTIPKDKMKQLGLENAKVKLMRKSG
ncbi:MAG TPA: aldehyde ferredoxin oxidoreductase family protein [Spirochaetota bacterium]|nr:aldehyde ferredoxin oxidoreductase family protein [Spirochaetota bacterium]